MKYVRLLVAVLVSLVCAQVVMGMYDPQTGRFLSRDPMGEPGGVSLYGYTYNDPVNNIDPYGLNVSRGGIREGRYKYTCNCGWVDTDHVSDYSGKFAQIWNALKASKKGHVDLVSAMPGIRRTVFKPRRYQYDYSQAQDLDMFTAAFEILYRGAYQEEIDQASCWAGRQWTAFGYEDVNSDIVGGLVGHLMATQNLSYDDALKKVMEKCDVVTKEKAEQVFDANERGTFSKQVKSAAQPECVDPVCTEEQKKAKYDDWEKAAKIAGGADPGGQQPWL
mgnify:FL=1